MNGDIALPNQMDDEVVVITGGTRGIGRATTEAFAARGATVVAGYHSNEEAATETTAALEDAPGTVTTRPFDVRNYEEVSETFEDIVETHGKISVLVNNAGVLRHSLLLRMDPEEWSETIETNLTGTFNCTKSVISSMVREDGGSIVNLSSVAAQSSWSGQANYVASKAGIDGFTQAAARELAHLSIRVNAVAPGLVDTESYNVHAEEDVDVGESENVPQGRIANPEEIAECIVFLASDEASYINGEVLRVDGGMLA